MLNYIWAFLIIVSLITAIGYDIYDEVYDTYRNGQPLIFTSLQEIELKEPQRLVIPASISSQKLYDFYGVKGETDFEIVITLNIDEQMSGTFIFKLPDNAPKVWETMSKVGTQKGYLSGKIKYINTTKDKGSELVLIFEPVHFVKLRSMTNAAIDYVTTAVNIAIGLIGIMSLWLGLMKLAEAAGVLTVITNLIKPVTRRLFPDVSDNHPALAAMVMNTAANMLGLSNAATPLGLKAMEELNKLNPHVGTATNAMVTFLTINTGGLVLIPATAIAVRAAAGSVNPGIIIGTSIVGALCATIAGVTASKLLQRLPRYRLDNKKDKQIDSET